MGQYPITVTHEGRCYRLADLARYMDDATRDRLHMDLAPCTGQAFWDAYVSAQTPEDVAHVIACCSDV